MDLPAGTLDEAVQDTVGFIDALKSPALLPLTRMFLGSVGVKFSGTIESLLLEYSPLPIELMA